MSASDQGSGGEPARAPQSVRVQATQGIPSMWYLGVAMVALGMFVLSMGGGLWGLDHHHLYHRLAVMAFDPLCHQAPDRSLMLSGTTMAVCSRCLGIYGAFSIGLLLFPGVVGGMRVYSFGVGVRLILLSLGIMVLDFIGNGVGLWTNTHLSRILTGVFFGCSLSWFMAGERNNQPKAK
jgi:uncharacterized membrane protein